MNIKSNYKEYEEPRIILETWSYLLKNNPLLCGQ